VSAIVKAYKHVRDAIVYGTPIDEEVMNLVNIVPHRTYWDGFLFNPLEGFPDGEDPSHPGGECDVGFHPGGLGSQQTTGTTA